MDVLIDTIIETPWGVIILGCLILGAIFIEFFSNKPKI